MPRAELFDGTVLEFPDDTPHEVIARVAREQTLARQPSPAGAGRGMVVPPAGGADIEMQGGTPAAETQPTPAGPRRGTMRGVAPFVGGDERVAAPPSPQTSILEQPRADFQPSQADLIEQSKSPETQQRALEVAQARRGTGQISALPEPAAVDRAAAGVEDALGGRSIASQVAGAATRSGGDLGLSLLKAAPETIKLASDIAQLGTGGMTEGFSRFLQATSDAMGAQQSTKLREEHAALTSLMQNPDAGVGAIAAFLMTHPEYAVNAALPSAGSMLLGAGGAKLGVAAAERIAARRGIVGAELQALTGAGATAGATGANALMNAGSTFADTHGDLGDKYTAAGVAGASTALGGRLFDGGAEAALVRGAAGKSRLGAVGGTALKEGGQEAFESTGQQVGQAIGEDKPLDPNAIAKQATLEGGLGALMGAGAGAVARVAPPVESLTSYMARQPAGEILPPTKARTESIRRFDELAAQFGLNSKALARAKEQAATMPAGQVAGFLAKATAAFDKRGLFSRPIDEDGMTELGAMMGDQAPASVSQGTEAAAPEAQAVSNIEQILGAPVPATPQGDLAAAAEDFSGLADTPAAPASSAEMAGEPINRAWTAFTPESGSLNLPREQLPQIKAEHRGALVNFLNARGVAHEQAEVPAADLKPTQGEFSPKKVQQAREFEGGDRSILVSSDGYVLDGHHQWLAKMDAGEPVKVIRLDAPIQDLLRLAHQFPSSTTARGARPAAQAAGDPNGAKPDAGGPAGLADRPADGGGDQPAGGVEPVGELPAAGGLEGVPAAPEGTASSGEPAAPVGDGSGADAPLSREAGAEATPDLRPYADMSPEEQAAFDQRHDIKPGRRKEVADKLEATAQKESKLKADHAAAFGPKTAEAIGAVGAHRVIARAGRTPNAATPLELRANPDGTLTPYHEGYALADFDSGEPIVLPADVTDLAAKQAIRAAGAVSNRTNFYAPKKGKTDDANQPSAAAPEAKAAPVEAAAAEGSDGATGAAEPAAAGAADVQADGVGRKAEARGETTIGGVQFPGMVQSRRGPDEMLPPSQSTVAQASSEMSAPARSGVGVSNSLPGFDRYGAGPAEQDLAERQVEALTGVRFPVRTVDSMASGAPGRFSRSDGVVHLSSKVTFTQGGIVETLAEEFLHGVDSIGPTRALSTASQRLAPDGDIRMEVAGHHSAGGEFAPFLHYPLGDVTLNESRVRAELFARLGVMYLSNPGQMRAALPTTFEAYHAILWKRGISPDHDRLPRQVRRGHQSVDQERGDDRSDGQAGAGLPRRVEGRQSDRLADLRARVVEQFATRGDGGYYRGGLSSPDGQQTELAAALSTAPARRQPDPIRSALQTELRKITAGWANAPEVVVIDTMDDAPAEMREANAQQLQKGADDTPSAFVHGGKVYIVASQFKSMEKAAESLFHEALGHMGLHGLFGADLQKVLRQMAASMPDALKAKAAQYGLDLSNPEQRLLAAEELLAEIAETRPTSTWVRKAVAAIREWLRKHIPALADMKWSDAEIIEKVIIPARRFIEEGRGQASTAGEPAMAFQRVGADGPKAPEVSWRDSTGRLQIKYGEQLYQLIGRAAKPLLVKTGMQAASPELRRQLRQMRLDVAKAQETAAAVAREANKLSEGDRLMVSDIIEKDLKAGFVPPEHAVRLAAVMNQTMSAQTKELVELGMLSAEAAQRWDGAYLPRFYESKLSKKVDAWADAMKRMFRRPSTMQGIRGKHLKGRGLYENIATADLPHYEAMGWEVRDPDFDAATDDQVQVWRDYTRAERDDMGEIRDAGFRFIMGYMQTQRDIALGRMFKGMAENEKFSSRLSRDGWVQVPDTKVPGTGAKRYGALGGRYVPQEVLSHLSQIEEAQSAAWQMYRKGMAIWKESKTALNPVSHFNNVSSNLTMAHFAGVSYHRADKYIGAMRDFATKAPMIQEAKEAGLFLGTMSDAELMNTLPKELQDLAMQAESKTQRGAKFVFNAMTFFLRKPMGAAYQAEDTFFRFLLYKEGRSRGLAPPDAVEFAQKFIFVYDDLPKGARMIRDFGLPFFGYTYKAAPALLHTALTHPDRFFAPAAVLWAVNAAAYAIAGGDDDDDWWASMKRYITDKEFRAKVRADEELERESLPPWMKGRTALGTYKSIRLGMDETTKLPIFIDMARVIPGGDLFDVSPNAGGLPIPQPITPSHPIFTTMVAMIGNRDLFTGKDLTDRTDTDGEAATKRSAWMWKQLSPAIAVNNYHWERTMNALAQANGGEVKWVPDVLGGDATGIGRDGLPVQPKFAAMQSFGIKARPLDIERSVEIGEAIQAKMIREIEAEIRTLERLNEDGVISDRVLEKKQDEADLKIERLEEGLTVDGKKR